MSSKILIYLNSSSIRFRSLIRAHYSSWCAGMARSRKVYQKSTKRFYFFGSVCYESNRERRVATTRLSLRNLNPIICDISTTFA